MEKMKALASAHAGAFQLLEPEPESNTNEMEIENTRTSNGYSHPIRITYNTEEEEEEEDTLNGTDTTDTESDKDFRQYAEGDLEEGELFEGEFTLDYNNMKQYKEDIQMINDMDFDRLDQEIRRKRIAFEETGALDTYDDEEMACFNCGS